MPYNGSGVWTAPAASFPAVSGTVIDSAKYNAVVNDIASALTSVITKDGQTTVTANLPMATYRHTGVSDGASLTDYTSVNQVVDNTLAYGGASAVGTDAYAVNLPISPGAYVPGNRYQFKTDVANTGACTIDFSSLGAKPIKLSDGSDPHDGAIQIGMVDVIYDGTNFVLLNPYFTGLKSLVTKTELDILDGATVTTSELNILDGATVTTSELNILDGATVTTSELNYVDGVTSDIQTQLNAGTQQSILNNSNHISGLILSNDTDTAHDINITAGNANDSTNTYSMNLATEITKKIDATWAAGDDLGGLFTGTVAIDTCYHVFLIRKDSDGTIDAGFDTSVTAANIPVGYTANKWIGAILTDGSANILSFTHDGDRFFFNTLIAEYGTSAETGSAVTRTLSTPLGIRVNALLIIGFRETVSAPAWLYVSDLSRTDEAATSGLANINSPSALNEDNWTTMEVMTNTSSQIRTRADSSGGATSILTYGWEVDRGSV